MQTKLAGTVWQLFLQANSYRETCGGAHDLRTACARQLLNSQDEVGERAEVELPDYMARPAPYCGCDSQANESCDVCEDVLPEVCTMDQSLDWCKQHDPFDGLAHKLTMVKISDYTAAAESFYAPVGNKPAELKANPVVEVPEAEMQTAASVFYEYIQKFLDDNEVTIDEIPFAFNLGAMNDLVDNLSRTAQEQLQQEIQEGLDKAEDQLEATFNRAKLMQDYLKVIDDTSYSPIGVLWYDHNALGKDFKATRSGLKTVYEMQPDCQRIEPSRIWFTSDWREDRKGRAVFTTRQLSAGDLIRVSRKVEDETLRANISELLKNNEMGYRMYSTHLFYDTMTTNDGMYDILVGRGTFSSEELREVGVKLPNKDDTMHQAEVWYAGGEVLHAQIIPCYIDNYGVYTTNFRTFGDSIWGISLYDFVMPFARMYEGAIRGIDSSVAKTTGSIIAADVGVIDDFDSLLQRNKDGTYSIDLAGDTLLKFDSTDAMLSPNWKGVPIQVTKLPTNLPSLMPTLGMALEQIEIISGIPRIIASGNPGSSAVRTDDSYKTAHRSASKKIASLLRRSKDRVLMKIIIAFYRTLVDSGLLRGLPVDVTPELLMDERLTHDVQSSQSAGLILNDLAPFMDRIPTDTVNSIVNNYIRQAHGVQYDVIPGANPVGNATPAQETGEL